MKKLLTLCSVLTLSAGIAFGVSEYTKTSSAAKSVETRAAIELKFISSTPAEGAELAELPAGYTVKIEPELFYDYPEMYLEYEIERRAVGDWETVKSYSWMTRDDAEECYVAELPRTITVEEGYDYRIKVSAWGKEADTHVPSDQKNANKLGVGYVNFRGTTKAVLPSPYSLVSITPEPSKSRYTEVLSYDCPYLTVAFNGPVNLGSSKKTGIILGMGAGLKAFASIDAVGESETVDGEVFAKEWNLVFPEGYIDQCTSPLSVAVSAHDEEGRILHNSNGDNELTSWTFSYNVPGQYGTVMFDFGKEPRSEVHEITASFADGIDFAYSTSYGSAYVEKDGVKVAEIKDITSIFDSESLNAISKSASMLLDKTLIDPGLYTLHVPDGYFNLGTQFMVSYQKAVEVTFAISSDDDTVSYSIVPESGTVDQLYSFDIQYDLDGEIDLNAAAGLPYLLSDQETSKIGFRSIEKSGNTLSLELNARISDAANYTLVVPTGYVTLDSEPVAGITVQYVIEKSDPIGDCPAVFEPAAGTLDALPEYIDIVFPMYEEAVGGPGKATIQYQDEAPVTLPDCEFGEEWNEMLQPLGEFAGKNDMGKYVITFPKGYFLLGSEGTDCPAMEIVYFIGVTQIDSIQVNANHYIVYDQNGVKVLDTAKHADLDSLKGLYIVNGVKMVLK